MIDFYCFVEPVSGKGLYIMCAAPTCHSCGIYNTHFHTGFWNCGGRIGTYLFVMYSVQCIQLVYSV